MVAQYCYKKIPGVFLAFMERQNPRFPGIFSNRNIWKHYRRRGGARKSSRIRAEARCYRVRGDRQANEQKHADRF